MRFLLTALLLFPAAALAQPRVGFVGLTSGDLSSAELARVEDAVGAALARTTRFSARGTTLEALAANAEVTRGLEDARAAAAAAAAALRTFDVAAATREFDRASGLYDSNHGARLVPGEVSRLHERMAMMFYAQNDAERMRREIALAARAQPARLPDPKTFPPEALAAWNAEVASFRASGADPAELVQVARRSGISWIASGEARVRDGALEVLLTIGGAEGGTFSYRGRVPGRDALDSFSEVAVAALLESAGITPRATAANAIPTSGGRRGPKKSWARDRRVWVAGGLLLAVGAAAAIAATSENPAPNSSPEGGGTVIVFPPQ